VVRSGARTGRVRYGDTVNGIDDWDRACFGWRGCRQQQCAANQYHKNEADDSAILKHVSLFFPHLTICCTLDDLKYDSTRIANCSCVLLVLLAPDNGTAIFMKFVKNTV
jgi:hypothetical protein